jgi:hypothetical protein
MRKVPSPETCAKAGQEAGPGGVSRRTMLAGVAIAGVGAVCLASTGAIAQSKQKQADVQYQSSPKDGQKCSGCALFQAPNACSGVEGEISPEGWCSIFAPKA